MSKLEFALYAAIIGTICLSVTMIWNGGGGWWIIFCFASFPVYLIAWKMAKERCWNPIKALGRDNIIYYIGFVVAGLVAFGFSHVCEDVPIIYVFVIAYCMFAVAFQMYKARCWNPLLVLNRPSEDSFIYSKADSEEGDANAESEQ